MFTKFLLTALLVLVINAVATLQSPVAQNYSSEVLRLAKAAQIKAYLNEGTNPCDNFYKFACGRWGQLHPAKEYGAQKTTYLEQLQDLYVRKSAEMLEGDRKADSRADVMLKDFYASCNNKSAGGAQHLGIEPIIELVNLTGGWPRITSKSWYEYDYDWLRVVAEIRRKLGVDIIIGLDVVADFEDKDMNRIKVGAPKLELKTKEAYLSKDYASVRDNYKRSIAAKLHQYFDEMPETWANEIADQVLDLERQLAHGLPDNPKLTLKQISRQRYATELKQAYGSFVDLSRYLNYIFNQTIYVQVYETPEDYMSNLVEVIQRIPKLTLANYTMWRVINHFDLIAEPLKKQHEHNWCVQQVIEYFPHQLESMFNRNYNNMLMINELQSVWADIKGAFRAELQTSTKLNWITADTRQKAVLKLDAMSLEFVTHDEDNNEEQLYGLALRRDKYQKNLIKILQWKTKQKLAQLVEKPKASSNNDIKLPKYKLTTNKIQIPITFLQPRFFWDETYPNALKYSTLGFLLAHEMLHGFDAIGRKHDKHGYQRTWWDTVSEYTFDERATCFTKQYANYKFHGKEVVDPNVITTSIADNGGLAIAYRAYQKWWTNVADNIQQPTNETLPLLHFTQGQLFFIGFAQLWCADYHKSIDNFKVLPERLRVVGALANLNEFAREFECESGGKMNQEKKCVIY